MICTHHSLAHPFLDANAVIGVSPSRREMGATIPVHQYPGQLASQRRCVTWHRWPTPWRSASSPSQGFWDSVPDTCTGSRQKGSWPSQYSCACVPLFFSVTAWPHGLRRMRSGTGKNRGSPTPSATGGTGYKNIPAARFTRDAAGIYFYTNYYDVYLQLII